MVWEGALLPRFDKTIVLVTRPLQGSKRFVEALSQIAPPFQPIISPAFENEKVSTKLPDFEAAIFTSQAGVGFAPPGQGRTAYCVGELTAKAARMSGYDSVSADGDATDLINMILSRHRDETLIHIRGEVSHGNVSFALRKAGLRCQEVIVYRKRPMLPTKEATAVFESGHPVVLPLFSSETVSIIAKWPFDFTASKIVAISPLVARESQTLSPLEVHVCQQPNMAEMARLSARLIA